MTTTTEPAARARVERFGTWERRRIKTFAREVNDRSVDGDEELLTVSHLTGVTPRSEKNVSMFLSESLEGYKRVQPGDLVVNTMWAWMGALGIARQAGVVSPSYGVYRLNPLMVDPRFIELTLRTPQAVAEIEAISTGVWTSRLRLYPEDLLGIRVWLPQRDVQTQIADSIEEDWARADAVVARRREMRELIAEREQAVLREMVMEAPGSMRSIASLAEFVNGSPFKPDDFTPDGLPVIRIAQLVDPEAPTDFFDGRVPPDVVLTDGDLVFSWSASLEVRLWDRGRAILNQHLFRVLPRPGIDKRWLRWALHVARDDFREHMHGSTMTHITQPMMRAVRVPVPSPEAQARIGRLADDLHAVSAHLMQDLDRQIGLVQERRHALVAALVTGQSGIPGVDAWR